MHSGYYANENPIFTELDYEVLRFLHDERVPPYTSPEESISILEEIFRDSL